MPQRSSSGRGLFYSRDSGGRHETTPGQYVLWALQKAHELQVDFQGTPEQIEVMIRDGLSHNGDLFLDYGVTGNKLSRQGLDALINLALNDHSVSHVFIPRRDRFARPDDPLDAMRLENLLSGGGLTLVFMDKVVPPRKRGRNRDISHDIVALIDYQQAGDFRRELAQKILNAQLTLARAGFSTGGRAPYGFRRWLVRFDGTAVRALADGEYVRMAGHHVVWLPGPEEEWVIIRRILSMLKTTPASRVAAFLTSEGIPSPDAGRTRVDRGVRHATSGVWHQTTITNIARNPLLLAIVSYGRRSMGDQLRFAPEGPRDLQDSDLRNDQQPKVIANAEANRISVPARFEPLVDLDQHRELLRKLDERGATQRGKARSRKPGENPLGARVFDMACGWPMYRQPYNGSFRYLCGLYQQSHAAECSHNHVDGRVATSFLLASMRQRILVSGFRTKIEQKLRALAERQHGPNHGLDELNRLRTSLSDVRQKRDLAAKNLALAANEDQHRAIAAVFDQLAQEEQTLTERLRKAEEASDSTADVEAELASALSALDHIADLAQDPANLESIGLLFTRLNVRLFLKFEEVQQKKRRVHKVAGGVVTFGTSPPPIPLYEGPTGRRALQSRVDIEASALSSPAAPQNLHPSSQEGQSSGNVSRGERI